MSISDVPAQSLRELMNRQQSELSDDEVERLVVMFRELREKIKVEAKAPAKSRANDSLSLEDLDL